MRLSRAAVANVAGYALAIVLSFVSFRAMIALTSVATVGTWALFYGLAGFARVGDLGLGTNMARYLASRREADRRTLTVAMRSASLLALGPVVGFCAVLALPVIVYVAGREGVDLPVAVLRQFLLAALASAVLGSANGLLASFCTGLGRVVAGSASTIAYNSGTLILLVPGVALFGAAALGWANVGGLLVQTVFLLVRLAPTVGAAPAASPAERPSTGAFVREIWPTTMQNFGAVLLRQALDPLTRLFVSRSSDISLVAYYELAWRIASQVRGAAGAGLQPLIYVGASDLAGIRQRFARPLRLALRVAGLAAATLCVGAPLASVAFFGTVAPSFVAMLAILALGTMPMIAGSIGHYFYAARGEFGKILEAMMLMVAVNALVGLTLSWRFGPLGAVVGYSAAFAVGAAWQLRDFARLSETSVPALFSRLAPATVLGFAASALFLVLHARFGETHPWAAPGASVLLGALLVVPAVSLARDTIDTLRRG